MTIEINLSAEKIGRIVSGYVFALVVIAISSFLWFSAEEILNITTGLVVTLLGFSLVVYLVFQSILYLYTINRGDDL